MPAMTDLAVRDVAPAGASSPIFRAAVPEVLDGAGGGTAGIKGGNDGTSSVVPQAHLPRFPAIDCFHVCRRLQDGHEKYGTKASVSTGMEALPRGKK
jgi:hypothetical protein